jgi:hypothetical protein
VRESDTPPLPFFFCYALSDALEISCPACVGMGSRDMIAALGMAVEKTIKACLEHAAARSRTSAAKTTPAHGVKRERLF